MLSAWMFPLALSLPAADSPRAAVLLPAPPEIARRVRDRFELRKAYIRAAKISAKRNNPDPLVIVPELCLLYGELHNCRDMAGSERAGKRRALKIRLEYLRDKLIRGQIRLRREMQRAARRSRSKQPRLAQAQAAGASELRCAQSLIDLITNTIKPESWLVNGGRGTISYYQPLKVLVIRNTGEVHGQLGNILPILNR